MSAADISSRTVERLSLYRRLLSRMTPHDRQFVFSHELAVMSGCTAAQVRRDLMAVGCPGTTTRGYNVSQLTASLSTFLDDPQGTPVALVGVGNLGRAVIAYTTGQLANLTIAAAFDSDPLKVNRVIFGCRTYPVEEIGRVLPAKGIVTAIIAVPAEGAQITADRLVAAGVRGLLNFAPVALKVPAHVFLENIDIAIALEKVAYFARCARGGTPAPPPAPALQGTGS